MILKTEINLDEIEGFDGQTVAKSIADEIQEQIKRRVKQEIKNDPAVDNLVKQLKEAAIANMLSTLNTKE